MVGMRGGISENDLNTIQLHILCIQAQAASSPSFRDNVSLQFRFLELISLVVLCICKPIGTEDPTTQERIQLDVTKITHLR